jgi:hypothetical protein
MTQVAADVVPIIRCEPESLVFEARKPESKTIRLEAHTKHECSVVNARADSRYFEVAIGKDRKSVTCRYIGTTTTQEIPTFTLLIQTNHLAVNELTIPIRAE